MPIDDLTALGDALRAARKEKNLTQEQLADESHISTKQIADIEKARRNPSYLILKALAKVVHLSLDSLMYPDLTPDEAGQNEMNLLYMNCPPEMRKTLPADYLATSTPTALVSEISVMKNPGAGAAH